jgi:hypothetical protein
LFSQGLKPVCLCDLYDTRPTLDVEVLDVERVVFDEFAAGFDVFAHERGEDGLGFGDVFELDLSSVRRSGSMVVSQSCVAVISPRPL